MEREADSIPSSERTTTLTLWILAAITVWIHWVVGNKYGFHRDELQFLDDARHLAWGYVAYPPLTSFLGRVAISLFGVSPAVFRLPASLTNACSLVLTALVARAFGGRRMAQVAALLAGSAVALVMGSLMQYVSFDYTIWALLAWSTAMLLRTGDRRWWLAAGAAVGLGILNKYTIAFPAVSLIAGLAILPSQRGHLRSRWFWGGVALAILIGLPHLVWEARHGFITLRMEHFVHLRDVGEGRAAGYWTDQPKLMMLALPLALLGLWRLARHPRFRLMLFLFAGPVLLVGLAQGRSYYVLPAYIPLYAAGAVWIEEKLAGRALWLRGLVWTVACAALLLDAIGACRAYLPFAQPGSALFRWQMKHDSDLADEIGWPEFVAKVASVRDQIPAQDTGRLAILAGNYGEAGALALYGPRYALPTPISGVNSFYLRGYGSPDPQTVIVVGFSAGRLKDFFHACTLAARVYIPYSVRNEESVYHPEIFVCRDPVKPWGQMWPELQSFQ